MAPISNHWADITADKIIREKGDKDLYTIASGITPSGRVHFGNFREAITVNLVRRALEDRGKKVRSIHSWDDFDTFRKVPKDIEDQEKFASYLFQPIVDVPDPWGKAGSYAEHFEQAFEREAAQVGVDSEFLYQAAKYRSGEYRDQIYHALKHTKQIKEILNEYRTQPLSDDWLPVSIYCPVHLTDQITRVSWDGEDTLRYVHEAGHEGELNLRDDKDIRFVKLRWRIDWPMRWAYEKLDFEPAGKDHSSDGGSTITAQKMVDSVFNWSVPVYLQYDFVKIKGGPGKMSSSEGGVVTVTEVLKIYEPEMIRWIFASYKPNVDFAIGFDEDVIKTYELFDRQERMAFGLEEGNEKKLAAAKRAYELAQIEPGGMPTQCPIQPSFRHLTTVLQIHEGDIEKARAVYQRDIKTERDERRFLERARCAKNWLELYAPDEFIFKINGTRADIEMTAQQKSFVSDLAQMLQAEWESLDSDKALHDRMYEKIHEHDLDPKDVFRLVYQLLISRDKGPRLASFMRNIGKEKVVQLLSC